MMILNGHLASLPICPICEQPVRDPEMHEVLLTRGNVMGAPFEARTQIFVSCNVVLVHPGECHRKAQHGVEGLMLCTWQLLDYNPIESILGWLEWMECLLKDSKTTYLQEFIASFCHTPKPSGNVL